jgi:tetratricopeptide (TPR) repeat protein
MAETNSLNFLDQTTPPPPSTDNAAKAIDAAGKELLERLGVGGMGEVYRFADDALRRDLAIKVLKDELRGNADAEERFLREARLAGSLQHPGVVPIHQLSRFADGRPCYTMKLVRGRTLADLLHEEPEGPERLPQLLSILEKVCQAVAYAHSKHVIHRDLKPSNVMVGEFGEVQVMDWGLAKELSHTEPVPPTEATEEVETAAWTEEGAGLSRAGSALGTPAYMPPEQAAGDWDIVDERADVFALGAILCEMLTGQPPYHGANRDDLLRRARRGDLTEALGQLEKCGVDGVLVELCRDCLAAERLQRPRHAGVVAARLAAYQAEVQERLRRAEVERAETEVRMREEGRRRRLTMALAVLVLLVVTGGGAALWWRQQQLEKTERAVTNGLAQADLLAEQARADPLQTDKYRQALEAARVAAQLAESASAESLRRAQELIARLEREEEAARKDRELLAALLDVRGPREGPKYQSDAKGAISAMAEPTADEQFAAAFRRWGLDVDGTAASEAAELLKARPQAVVTELNAALDEWASERRRQGKAKEDWQRLLDLAALLDDDPGSKRRELRQIWARGRLPLERALGMLSAALRPVPLPVEVPLGQDRARLRQLTEQTDAAREPILGLLTLVRALQVAGEEARAEQLLREAIVARPRKVVLHHTLGQLLVSQQPPRWAEAVASYGAARTLRPDLGVSLATALQKIGRDREGLSLLARLMSETPTNPYLHFQLAYALAAKGQLDEAMVEYRQAIALDPKHVPAHNNLGAALRDKGQLDEAVTEYRQAIALDPKLAPAHNNLGNALRDKGQLDEAVTEYLQAIALDPKLAPAHYNLGNALKDKGRLDEAVAEWRQALALDPKDALAHYNLGVVLRDKGQLDEAMAEYRQAIALDPKYAPAHNNLGLALAAKGQLDEAMAEYRQAIALDPKLAPAHYNLGNALKDKGRLDEAVTECRQAIALDPKLAPAHNNLGNALYAKGQLDEAMAEYRQAIALDPKLAPAHYNLGAALRDKGQLDEAMAEYRQAIALDPKYARAHYNLGVVLRDKGQLDEAMAEWRQAIALDPKLAPAHNNLGAALRDKGQLDEAMAEYRQAIALDPKLAPAHYNLGNALQLKGQLDEAMVEYRQAIRLKPDYAEAHCILGLAMQQQGRFDEALASLRRGHELGSKQPGWRNPSAQWVQNAERMLVVDKKLPAILSGEESPANPGEAVALASLCQQPYRKRYAASARLYADAFTAELKLAADNRYNAACSAALAAAGQGEDARSLPDKERSRLRRLALGWLRDDLTAYAKLAEQNNPAANKAVQQRLTHWRSDPDLASVRDPQALERLPENERADWQALWRDVDKLAKRVAERIEPNKGRKKLEKPQARSFPLSMTTGR